MNLSSPFADTLAVSVLTVGFQSQDFIDECFGSLFDHHPDLAMDVLFVDNGDGATEARVRQNFPQVRVIESRGNIGFGAGNNLLAKHARGRRLLLLNPDARFIDDSLTRLLAFADAHPRASIWGGITLDKSLRADVVNDLRYPRLGEMAAVTIGLKQFSGPAPARHGNAREVEVICGGFMLIDREAWAEADGFDETFFLYSEEVDLMYRMHKVGRHFLMTDQARVVHEMGGGTSLSASRQMYKTIGGMHYMRKHWGTAASTAGGVLIWMAAVRRWLIGGVLAYRSERFGELSRAFRPIATQPWKWWRGYR